jgi:hypothetical protein
MIGECRSRPCKEGLGWGDPRHGAGALEWLIAGWALLSFGWGCLWFLIDKTKGTLVKLEPAWLLLVEMLFGVKEFRSGEAWGMLGDWSDMPNYPVRELVGIWSF